MCQNSALRHFLAFSARCISYRHFNVKRPSGMATAIINLLVAVIFVASRAAPTTEQLNLLLAPVMSDVSRLQLLLRREHLQLDAVNAYALWFLHHSPAPLTVHIYDRMNAPQLGNRESSALVTTVTNLSRSANQFVHRAGVLFFILSDQKGPLERLDQQYLISDLRALWLKLKIFKCYILADDGIWHYNPFDQQLMPYEGKEPLQKLLFHNMHGYPLRVQIFKSVYARPEFNEETGLLKRISGADALVAQLLSERLNFSMQLQQPDKNYFGERSENGSYNGAIGSIITDGLDICLTGFFVKDYMVDEFMDFSVAVYDDQLCIYVPKALRIPQSILPVFAVGYDIWLGFILSAFGCSFIWLFFRLLNLQLGIIPESKTSLWRQALCIMVDTWVVWVRVNLSHLPSSYAERIFIGSLCLVSVIFGAIFESSLATVYIHPLHYKDINTLQELDDSGLKVVYKYTSMADDLFFSETSPLFASLNKKLWWNRNLHADVINEVAMNRDKAGVTRYSSLILESSNYLLSRRIWVVPECPKYYTISYVMPKDSPWSEAINALLLRLLSAGIIEKWIDDMKTKVDIAMRGKMLESDEESSTFRVLTIGDLQLAFYVVFCGNMVSSLGFLAEHWWIRRDSKEN